MRTWLIREALQRRNPRLEDFDDILLITTSELDSKEIPAFIALSFRDNHF